MIQSAYRQPMRFRFIAPIALLAVVSGCASVTGGGTAPAADNTQLLSVDRYVPVRSTAPSMNGQTAQLYVRERVEGRSLLHGSSGVVLFVHGAGTPAEVAFDVPYSDYSWMAYLAHGGFDVFSMDMTGYGRSTRPTVMNDPCNLARAQQRQFVPGVMPAPCAPSFQGSATTIASDWNDIGAVIDYLRTLRHVERVSLVGWSQGGPRAGGYAGQHPDRVQRLVLLAPAYARTGPDGPPAVRPDTVVFNTQSQPEFDANWDRQVGCPGQYDKSVSGVVWAQMVASDPVGSTWNAGVRRAPTVPGWGWNQAVVSKNQTPTLMVTGAFDKQVSPDRVRELYADLAAQDKVLVDLACSSHNAMWEANHTLMFKASLDWLTTGSVGGTKNGILRLGYEKEQKSVN
jgi:pimeloyl-ACP methyl ester carboxylesterase